MAAEKKHCHWGHRQRLKQQFLAGGDALPDHVLLELLLFYSIPQRDVNEIAHGLMDEFGSIAGVLDASEEALVKVKGVGPNSAALIKLIGEIGRRYHATRWSSGPVLRDASQALAFFRPYFVPGVRQEKAYMACLDENYRVLYCCQLGEGDAGAVDIDVRQALEVALTHNAAQVILAHNHVSGVALASEGDKRTTEHLSRLFSEVGIHLVDHMIFVDDDMVSLRESRALPGMR